MGPDGRGAYTHTLPNTNGALSAVAIMIVEPTVSQFQISNDSEIGGYFCFNDPGVKDVVQDIQTVRWAISGLGDSANVSLTAKGPRSLSGSTVAVVDNAGKSWMVVLSSKDGHGQNNPTTITHSFFVGASEIRESDGEQPWPKPLQGRTRHLGII
tara:strand:+ start:460 stop:924 length:465 start_codon:yes stop_codon:yes gene_type:complete